MAEIILLHGENSIIDDADIECCRAHRWRLHPKGYVVTDVIGQHGRWTSLRLHRLLMNAPQGVGVDHVNGNRLDNRRANLRLATALQNNVNMAKRVGALTSRYKGVSFKKNRPTPWYASIRIRGKSCSLGVFRSELEAAQAYDCAAVLHFGAFARLNFGAIP